MRGLAWGGRLVLLGLLAGLASSSAQPPQPTMRSFVFLIGAICGANSGAPPSAAEVALAERRRRARRYEAAALQEANAAAAVADRGTAQ